MTTRTITKTEIECDYCHSDIRAPITDRVQVSVTPPALVGEHVTTLPPTQSYDYHVACWREVSSVFDTANV